MKRLAFVLALLAVVATLSVWAGPEAEKTAAAVKLTVLNSNTEKPERAEFFTRLAEKYTQLHPNVTIEVTSTSFTDVNTNILTAINAGTPYDVFTSTSPIWINKGVVLNLKPFLDADGGAWAKELYDSVIQGLTQPDGGIYAMSLWMDTTPLLYHKEIFTKLNLKVPTNTEEFITAAEALKGAGYIPFQVHGSMSDDLLNLLAWQFAAKYNVKAYDVVQGKVPMTDPYFTFSRSERISLNDMMISVCWIMSRLLPSYTSRSATVNGSSVPPNLDLVLRAPLATARIFPRDPANKITILSASPSLNVFRTIPLALYVGIPYSAHSSRIATAAEVPMRVAPASMNSRAWLHFLMPPLALTPTLNPTVSLIN